MVGGKYGLISNARNSWLGTWTLRISYYMDSVEVYVGTTMNICFSMEPKMSLYVPVLV